MNKNGITSQSLNRAVCSVKPSRGFLFGFLILGALIAFEIFNYSTTDFALVDLIGDLRFAGIRWATILAVAFCTIDFAGIARLFTPEKGRNEPTEVWYLFAAWLLAAAFNALLTWWGVSVAIVSHSSQAGGVVVTNATLTKVVPVFVAVMVWLIRVLIIGTFSVAGERLFSQGEVQARKPMFTRPTVPSTGSLNSQVRPVVAARAFRPGTKMVRPEPTYQNVPLQARSGREVEYVDPPLS